MLGNPDRRAIVLVEIMLSRTYTVPRYYDNEAHLAKRTEEYGDTSHGLRHLPLSDTNEAVAKIKKRKGVRIKEPRKP